MQRAMHHLHHVLDVLCALCPRLGVHPRNVGGIGGHRWEMTTLLVGNLSGHFCFNSSGCLGVVVVLGALRHLADSVYARGHETFYDRTTL